MNNTLLMDFTVDKAKNSIQVKREFAAGLPLVWDAFTKSELLDQWWAPKPWTARTKSMDFREGGHWLYAMVSPEGDEHWGKVTYETIQHQQGYMARDSFTDAAGIINETMPQATWESSFNNQGEGTLVTLHINYADLAQLETVLQMGMKGGLTMCLENLDELLATQKG